MQPDYNQGGGYSAHHNSSNGVAVFFIALMLVIGTGIGVYFWQKSQASSNDKELLARIEELEDSNGSPASGEVNSLLDSDTSGVSAYRTNVGDLELVLPDQYGIIVKVDGQFGESKRSILHISKKVASGVYYSVLNNYIEVEISPAKESAKNELKKYHEALTQNGYTLDKQYESTFQGYKGFLTTGKSTISQFRLYFLKSGDYAYKFAQFMPLDAPNEDNEDLLAVLNGMKVGGVKAGTAPESLKVN